MSDLTTAPLTPEETATKINDLRSRVLAGETISVEEYQILIQSYRAQRNGDVARSAEKTTAKKKKNAETAPKNLDDLLGSLGI